MPTRTQDMPQAMRNWIASHTLLGDPAADEVRDLIFFPVVNPSSGNLNAGALRAVLSGRGAQADIPDSALNSARSVASSLLEKEFSSENVSSNESIIAKVIGLLSGLLPAQEAGEPGKEGDDPEQTANETDPVANESDDQQETDPKEESMSKLLKDVAAKYGVEADSIKALPDEVLTVFNEYNPEPEPQPVANDQEGDQAPTMCAELQDLVEKVGGVPALVELVSNAQDAEDKEQAELLKAITANERCAFTEEELSTMPLDTLRKLAKSLATNADYSGQPDQSAPETEQGDRVHTLPKMA